MHQLSIHQELHIIIVFSYIVAVISMGTWQPITAKQEFVQRLKVDSNYGSHSCHASIKSIVVEFCVQSHRYVEPLWNLQSCIHFILCSLSICVYFVCHPFSLCVPRKSQLTHLKQIQLPSFGIFWCSHLGKFQKKFKDSSSWRGAFQCPLCPQEIMLINFACCLFLLLLLPHTNNLHSLPGTDDVSGDVMTASHYHTCCCQRSWSTCWIVVLFQPLLFFCVLQSWDLILLLSPFCCWISDIYNLCISSSLNSVQFDLTREYGKFFSIPEDVILDAFFATCLQACHVVYSMLTQMSSNSCLFSICCSLGQFSRTIIL